MTDREIFRKNLNDFLSSSGKLQKDLAEYVGAKTTTVSGWTRGISYPRADAMEKIAMFFGVPTSRLVEDSSSDADLSGKDEIRILFPGASKLSPERLELIKNSFLTMLKATNPELFKGNVADISTVLRVAITSKSQTPDLYEIMKLIGKDNMKERINLL